VFSVTIVSNCVGRCTSAMGTVVHQHVVERHVGIILRHASDHLAPQLRRQPARLALSTEVSRLRRLPRHLEPHARHPLDLSARCKAMVFDRARGAVGEVLHAARLAEVEPAGELADDHDVGASTTERFMREASTSIGKHVAGRRFA
jgi:hypothetical protein